ncbi:MAG: tetratricopeptide repeat protein, partial [Acidobacteriota bacterium]
ERLRITAELVDGASGFALWSGTFDRKLADVFAIQEEIALNIADALKVSLSRSEHEALGQPSTTDVQAYDLYLRGRKFYYQYRKRGVEMALEMFQRAIEIDPAYARAWAGIADCFCFFYLYVARIPENIKEAEAASRKALELNPELADAQASWGVALSVAGRHDEASAAFEKAIRLDPGLFEARYFYARHAFVCGDAVKAARLYEEAEELRPEDYQSPTLVAQIYHDLGQPEKAVAAHRRGLRKAEETLRLHPDDTRARYMGANALLILGEREKSLEWARAAIAQEPDEPMVLYNVGCIFSLAGELEKAINVLERAVTGGLTQRGWFEHDSNLDPLRGQPRFQALLRRL